MSVLGILLAKRIETTSPLVVLALALPLFGIFLALFIPGDYASPVAHVLASSCLILGAAALVLDRAFGEAPPLPRSLALGLVIVPIMVSALLPRPLTFERAALGLRWTGLVFGALTLRALVRRYGLFFPILRAIVAVSTVLCLFAIAQRAGIPGISRDLSTAAAASTGLAEDQLAFVRSTRVSATFGQANGFAGFLVLMVPVILAFVLERSRAGTRRERAAWVAILLLHVAAFALAASKGATIVLVIQAGFLFALSVPLLVEDGRVLLAIAFRAIAPALVILGVLVAIALALQISGVLALKSLEPRLATLRLRQGYARTASSMIAATFPVGVGLGGFRAEYGRYKAPASGEATHAHNGYLEIVAELGLQGALLVILFLGFLYRRGRGLAVVPLALPPPSGPVRWIAWTACAAAFLAQLLHSFVTFLGVRGERFQPVGDGFFLAILTLFTLVLVVPSSGRRPERDPRIFERALFVALVGFALHSAVDFDLHVEGVAAAAAVLAAIAPGGARQEARATKRTRPLRSVAALGVAGAALAVFVFMTGHALAIARAGVVLKTASNVEQRIEAFERGSRGALPDTRLLSTAAAAIASGAGQLDDKEMIRVAEEIEGDGRLAAADLVLALKLARLWNAAFDRVAADGAPELVEPARRRALRAYERALSLYPGSPRLHWDFAWFLRSAGSARATEEFQQALDLSAGFEPASGRLTGEEALRVRALLAREGAAPR